MTVESMATRPVESMTPMSTGPRSERNPTPADAACSVLTGTRLGQLSDRGAVGAVAPARRRVVGPARAIPVAIRPPVVDPDDITRPGGRIGGSPHAEPRRIADHPRARDGAAADDAA